MISTSLRSASSALQPAFLPGFEPPPASDAARILSSPESWIKNFSASLLGSVLPQKWESPDAWAEHSILFTSPSDPVRGALDLSLSPFLRDPIRAWELHPGDGQREIVVVAPEQTGKTLSWMSGLLWSAVYRPGTSLVYYTSDDKAKLVNEKKFLPLIMNIPQLRAFIDLPNSMNAKFYRLGPSTVNFGGVGARISSITASLNVADEIDDWETHSGVSPLADLRKRSRAFSEGILCIVCTPKGTAHQSKIWKEFLRSSQGYWHLRCQGCGGLTMKSCDIHHLKFELGEKTEKGVHPLPIADSIRLVCPVCHHEHTEERDRFALVQQGDYIHKHPELIAHHPGFQFGFLANLLPAGSWKKIADAQACSGASADEDQQRTFDNSFRGLPYSFRRLDAACSRALHIHQIPYPDAATIKWRFLSADTQEQCFFYVVRGVDTHLNTYLLDSGKLDTVEDLKSVILANYLGAPILASIIDEGGHRQDEVRALADSLPRVYTYKGNTSIRTHWKLSSDYPRLILGHADFWRVALLQKVYAAARTDSYYWYTTEEAMSDEYIRQLSAWTRPASGKLADELADGDVSCYRKSDGADDHLFDAEKMCLMLIDYTWQNTIKPYLAQKLHGGAA